MDDLALAKPARICPASFSLTDDFAVASNTHLGLSKEPSHSDEPSSDIRSHRHHTNLDGWPSDAGPVHEGHLRTLSAIFATANVFATSCACSMKSFAVGLSAHNSSS